MKSIKQIKNLKGKKVLLRVDFNVPIKDGRVVDDFRIKSSLPTIDFLLKKGARVILISHLGKDGREGLEPVIRHFFAISKIDKSKVTFFDNIRKFPGEMENDMAFARDIAKLGDVYVNDAFSVSHRAHASVVLLPKLLPAYAGLQLMEEVKNLSRAFTRVKHPFLFILGGAKFSTKMPLIKKYLKLADYVFVGGALANDFLKASGCDIGESLVDDSNFGIEKLLKNKKLILPTDVFVRSDTLSAMAGSVSLRKMSEVKTEVETEEKTGIKTNEAIIDIGEKSVDDLSGLVKDSKLILWNGPLGKYEDGGAEATKKILKLISNSKAESIIGGGDLVSVLSSLQDEGYKIKANMFVSTGGGATLDFLADGTLPGIKALQQSSVL